MDAVGETPNIAARLQSLAVPNSVLIAEPTKRLVLAAFNFEDLGLRDLNRHRFNLRRARRICNCQAMRFLQGNHQS
jgi:class 3 adenylate cyclase